MRLSYMAQIIQYLDNLKNESKRVKKKVKKIESNYFSIYFSLLLYSVSLLKVDWLIKGGQSSFLESFR